MRKYLIEKKDNYKQTVIMKEWWKNKKIKNVISYLLSFINNNWESFVDSNLKSFLLVLIHGIILGFFAQFFITHELGDTFFNFRLLFILVVSVIVFLLIWITCAVLISKLSIRYLSKGVIYEILRNDSFSYIPFSVLLLIGMIFYLTDKSKDFLMLCFFSGLALVFFLKIFLYFLKPPNRNIPLQEKAHEVKVNLIKNTNDLEPDKPYINIIEVEDRWPLRKYMVNDEIRNGINLNNIKNGTIKINNVSSTDMFNYSIGWNAEDKLSGGNLKLFLIDGKSDKMIFNKDATNILNGWNEYQVSIPSTANSVEFRWENSIKDDVYLSIPKLPNTKIKKEHTKKNIIVIIFDGVIPETIGLYNSNSDADSISRFFRNYSVLFTNAYAQGEWTLPNFASIATSLYSTHHKVFDPDLYSQEMPHNNKTLAEILQENDYNTFGYFSCHRTCPGYGYSRGFNRYIYRFTGSNETNNHKDIIFKAINFLKRNQQTNNFVFLHVFDTHYPHFQSPSNISSENEALSTKHANIVYGNKKLGDDDFLYMRELYLQKFKEVDEDFSILFDYILKYEKDCTTVIFTADHGLIYFEKEMKNVLAAGEKGGRENYLIESILKVPFLVRHPEIKNHECEIKDNIVEANLTIMPTVLDVAGLKPPKNIDGVSLFSDDGITGLGKGYAIAESNFKTRYELFLKSSEFKYFLKTCKDRENSKIIKTATCEEKLFDMNDALITDKKSINELKKKISKLVKNNKLPNVIIDKK